MEFDARWKEALYIAEELGEDPEEVYDMILGNLTEPRDLFSNVERLSQDYSSQKERFLR